MSKNKEVTSKEVASKAAHVLKDPSATADEKSVAASALTQAADKAPEVPAATAPAISHNPAFLEWPTDIWGLTKDVKKAFVVLANRVKGQPDKMELVERTLEVALGHLNARYQHDNELRAARQEKAEAAAKAGEPEAPIQF